MSWSHLTGHPRVELSNGRLWRKRLLPVGDVQYRGRLLLHSVPVRQLLADRCAELNRLCVRAGAPG